MAEETRSYELMMEKADRSLRAARRLLADADCDFAASRAYYALFYALQAALESKSFQSSSHGSAISEFNRIFVKGRILPSDFGHRINRSFRKRQVGDYSFSPGISEADARSSIDTAQTVIAAIREYLVDSDLLPGGRPRR